MPKYIDTKRQTSNQETGVDIWVDILKDRQIVRYQMTGIER